MQRNQHILLVDDDVDDSMLFEEALGQLNMTYTFFHIADGDRLMAYLSSNELPYIIFLDLNMPGKNGQECLQEIRASARYNNVPVVIYSTSGGKRDIDACYKAGANFYIIKPDSFAAIVSRLKILFDIKLKTVTSIPKEQFLV